MSGRVVGKLMQGRKIFALEAPEIPLGLVPHPRFGSSIKRSGTTVTSDDLRKSRSLKGLQPGTFWPETAIRANPEGQAAYFGAHDWYVDQLLHCGGCGRPFIFYAREQQYFYEVLFVHPDVWCNYCVPCRRLRRDARARHERADASLTSIAKLKGPLTEAVVSDVALVELAEDLLARNERVFKNVALLGRLRRAITARAVLTERADVVALLSRLDARMSKLLAQQQVATSNRPIAKI